MKAAQDDSSKWDKHKIERQERKRTGRQFNRWTVVLFTGYLLVAAACWSILAIYGPVFTAEVGYQLRHVSLLPRWSFDPTGLKFAQGYGLVIPKIYVNETVVINVDPNKQVAYKANQN